jgi:hypothetical protein
MGRGALCIQQEQEKKEEKEEIERKNGNKRGKTKRRSGGADAKMGKDMN